MKEIVQNSSTNGRRGVTVVGPDEIKNVTDPIKGKLTRLGTIEGQESFEFIPGENGIWYLLDAGDTEVVRGATIVISMDLQSGNHCSIVALGDFAVIKSYGYKGRSSRIVAYKDGKKVDLPATVMAAMGLIEVDRQVVEVEIPPIDSPLAEALRKAGIV